MKIGFQFFGEYRDPVFFAFGVFQVNRELIEIYVSYPQIHRLPDSQSGAVRERDHQFMFSVFDLVYYSFNFRPGQNNRKFFGNFGEFYVYQDSALEDFPIEIFDRVEMQIYRLRRLALFLFFEKIFFDLRHIGIFFDGFYVFEIILQAQKIALNRPAAVIPQSQFIFDFSQKFFQIHRKYATIGLWINYILYASNIQYIDY